MRLVRNVLMTVCLACASCGDESAPNRPNGASAGEPVSNITPDDYAGGSAKSTATNDLDAGTSPPEQTLDGLPCTVQTIVSKYCVSCHGARPTGPMSLLQYSDFVAASHSAPSKTNAQLSLELMRASVNPMPPSGARPSATELQVFDAWVGAGVPKGACGVDAGASDAATPDTAVPADASATPASPTGLPCEVSALLSQYCVSCHGTHPSGGAPMSLMTYADLMARALSDPTKSAAQLSLELINSSTRPMPPTGARPTASQIQALSTWLTNGAPSTGCGTSTGDAGSGPVDPYATPVVCTSGTHWNGREGATMRPGEACISCHARSKEAPLFAIAGTLYPSAHEPDSCNGSSARATIEITDHNGTVHQLTPNTAGNFDWAGTIAFPYTAKVTYQGRVRAMATPQTSGDCNTCHTQSGSSGAPGRILLP